MYIIQIDASKFSAFLARTSDDVSNGEVSPLLIAHELLFAPFPSTSDHTQMTRDLSGGMSMSNISQNNALNTKTIRIMAASEVELKNN